MKKRRSIRRRTLIRTVSFTAALIVALGVTAWGSYTAARQNRTVIEYGYQRALAELSEYVGNLDIALEKGRYATSSTQLEGLSAKLWREAGFAKNALARLPSGGGDLSATYKFLSQVGDFCMVLSRRVAAGGTITEDEAAALDQLSIYARDIAGRLAGMESAWETGQLTLGEVNAVMGTGDGGQAIPGVADGFREMEEGFEDYPTLIYDGPFSDHILQQKAKFLEGRETVDIETALAEAKRVTGCDSLAAAGETAGNLPCYIFSAENWDVRITKAGGFAAAYSCSRPLGEASFTVAQALARGEEALRALGWGNFTRRYHSLNNGVLTINFARLDDGAVCYPDLVKVGIAMDTGEAVMLEAAGFLMNHTERDFPTPRVTKEKAKAALSPRLTVQGEPALAVIPSDGLNENVCYEFSCTGDRDDQVLVYVDILTGEERQILILLEDETGVLAM